MNPKDIIIRPIITEKSMAGMQVAEGESAKYTFEVDKNANKIEIAKAVEACFPGVKVIKVNTMHVRGCTSEDVIAARADTRATPPPGKRPS